MVFSNLKHLLEEAQTKANETNQPQEVKLIYNEITYWGEDMIELFKWLFINGVQYGIRYDEYRYVIIINPKGE